MALTLRSNGPAGGLVSSDWWNEYYDLLTGAMSDQPVAFKTNVTIQAISGPPAAPTVTITSGGAMSVGAYVWGIAYASADYGETPVINVTSATTTAGNTAAIISLPIGPNGTAARRIYRSLVGTTSPLYSVVIINDNTTTTYTDTMSDAVLATSYEAHTHSTFGGSIFVQDENGNNNFSITSDGSLVSNGVSTVLNNSILNGATVLNGSATLNGSTNTISGGTTFQSTISVTGTSYLAAAQLYGSLTMQPGTTVSLDNGTITSDGAGKLTVASLSGQFSTYNPTAVRINGANGGTATLYQMDRGKYKSLFVILSGFWNKSGSAQSLALPVAFNTAALIRTTSLFNISLTNAGSAQSINILTSLAQGGGGVVSATSMSANSLADLTGGFDSIQFNSGGSAAVSGIILIEGE